MSVDLEAVQTELKAPQPGCKKRQGFVLRFCAFVQRISADEWSQACRRHCSICCRWQGWCVRLFNWRWHPGRNDARKLKDPIGRYLYIRSLLTDHSDAISSRLRDCIFAVVDCPQNRHFESQPHIKVPDKAPSRCHRKSANLIDLMQCSNRSLMSELMGSDSSSILDCRERKRWRCSIHLSPVA